MNQLLITALEGAAELLPEQCHIEQWEILDERGRTFRLTPITSSGLSDCHAIIELPSDSDNDYTRMNRQITLPGLLRYLAGELGYEYQVYRWTWENMHMAESVQWDAWKKRSVYGTVDPPEIPGEPIPFDENDWTAPHVHAFAAIVERVKKERAQ